MLLGAICSVLCVELRHPPKEMNRIPNTVVCRSYCLHKYFECYRKLKCHRPDRKYRIQICREQYEQCFTKCKKELYEMDYDVGSEKRLVKKVQPVKRRGRGRPKKIRVD